MKELRIDRERAIKATAVAGLVVLGLSILPGLLKTPKAPELPPDVGFTAAETNSEALLPHPEKAIAPHSRTRKSSRNDKHGNGTARDRVNRRKSGPRSGRKRPRKSRNPDGTDLKRARTPDLAGSAPVNSAPAAPHQTAPAPALPAPVAPAPAPTPAAPSPPPGDGSQEFAPH